MLPLWLTEYICLFRLVMRGLQGLGGGGRFTITAVLIIDSAPPEKCGKYVSNASISIELGTMLGPIVGDAISQDTTWRWIFVFKYVSQFPSTEAPN